VKAILPDIAESSGTKIKEDILNGKQPRHLRLNDFVGSQMSLLWDKQLERFYA